MRFGTLFSRVSRAAPAFAVAFLTAGPASAQSPAGGPPAGLYTEWGPAQSIDPGGTLNVNTAALEGCPIESPDSHWIFFASDRPGGKGGIDIWTAYRQSPNHPWQEPVNLPEPVNSALNDFCPTPLTGGRLFFVSNRGSDCGSGGDIYQTRLHPVRGWMEPEHLGCEVNSAGNEFAPSLVERGGETILFFSSDRSGNHDIYSSTLERDGSWGAPTPQVELNSAADDARPNIRWDGLEIVFDSVRTGGAPDIWTSSRPSLSAPWSAPEQLGSFVNSDAGESRASLSRDGMRLTFGSSREGGQGSSDIYVSERDVASGAPASFASLPGQVQDLATSNSMLNGELADVKATLSRIARRLGVIPIE